MTEEDSIQGAWFSTSDMKLAVSLRCAGFKFKPFSECTRLALDDGRPNYTWHFDTKNVVGEDINQFLQAWETPIEQTQACESNMTCFLVAREAMFARHYIISQSDKVPNAPLRNRGDQKLIISPRLGRKEREALQRMAS